MAYIKFKEMTRYFNFYRELDLSEMPEYVTHYLSKGEEVHAIYCTKLDKCVFTDRKLILFDLKHFLGTVKKIHFFPYQKISSSAILFKKKSAAVLLTMESGYQVRLNFVNMNSEEKTHFRKIYYKMIEKIN